MKQILTALMIPVLALSLALTPVLASAVTPKERACEGAGGDWQDGACVNPDDQGGNLTGEGGIITNVINVLLFFAGIAAVIMIILGGFRYITANGDAARIGAAKNTILYSVVGLVVVIASFAIVNFVLDAF